MRIAVNVNARRREAEIEGDESLLWLLRERFGLTGTKNACEQGECGSCAVWLNDEVVNSCLVLAAQADGEDVRTVEAVGNGSMHPVQEALLDVGAVQCGFCTPGLVVTVADLLAHESYPDEASVREALSGHLCRCTGYQKVVEAVALAATRAREKRG